MKTDPYVGRLVCDGEGNLLADEGESKGAAVYYDADANAYHFVEEDGFSHNDRWQTGYVIITGTTPEDPHHEEPTPDDPHYDEKAPGKTRLKYIPRAKAGKHTGHTEAYTNV